MESNVRHVYPALVVRSLFGAIALQLLGHQLIRVAYRPGTGGPVFFFAEAARGDFDRYGRVEQATRAEADRARQAKSTTWPKDSPQ